MNASFNLMRRLPPNHILKNLGAITEMIQNDETRFEVQQKSDQPIGKFQHLLITPLRLGL